MSGRIVVKNLKTLITGRSSRIGTALSKHITKNSGTIYSLDTRFPKDLLNKNTKSNNEHFTELNVADQGLFSEHLRKIEPIDAFVNCTAVRKSYNYFLSYLQSKSLLEKLRENEINEFGCRGCIINLVHLSSQYDDQYFREQDEFAEKYKIDVAKIDDEVYALADQLTAARVRCNTVMVNEKMDVKVFADLVKHIIEDQYVSGQVINMEDNLRHKERGLEEVLGTSIGYRPYKKPVPEEKYVPPKEVQARDAPLAVAASSSPPLPLPDKS
ncbi:hypothetical protein TYRP_017932 [Tyrophagus putrescentiae]|nr:hypothetical protein TYRP_017932 [Tyrophagus putrescentiae]